MADDVHLLVINARYYDDIADELLRGAVAEIEQQGATHEVIEVPGVFEIPAAVRMAIRSMELVGMRRRFSGYVALGCVIRGETDHYDNICRESIRSLGHLAISYTLSLGFGILTCHTREQAVARAAVDKSNKGGEAVRAALKMIEVKRELGFFPR